jgi:hypothetical protein
MSMMTTRIALTSTALALLGAAALGALSTAAEAQAVSGGVYYYGPQQAYVPPPPITMHRPSIIRSRPIWPPASAPTSSSALAVVAMADIIIR